MSARLTDPPAINRFMNLCAPCPMSGCWLWLGAKDTRGYGQFWDTKHYGRRIIRAHRWAYENLVGPIPDGLQIDHLCRTRLCVNPQHLEAVTQKENVLRGIGITARNAKKERCPRGHEYAGKNLRETARGRKCVECIRIVNRARVRKKNRSAEREASP